MLVGRGAEQHAVAQLFAGARIGRGGALGVTGEPGVGKTALLEDVTDHLNGVRILRVTGTEAERDLPFAALHQILRPALHLLDSIPEPQAAALGSALALRVGATADRFAVGAATLGLVCRFAEEAPVAIVVDDLQWLDRPSGEALTFAARRIEADSVVVLLAARTGTSDDLLTGLPALRLIGLDADAAEELVRSQSGQPPSDEQMTRLHEATGGNPLALIELGGDLRLLDDRAPGLPPAVPARLAEAFSRRLSRIDIGARSALLVCVVANGDLAVIGAACRRLGIDPSGLGQAERAGLIAVSGGRVEVRHPLVRAAIYSEAEEPLRRDAHLAVAALLPMEDVERRAWHLAEATWAPDPEVAGLLVAAGDRAAARSAHTVASTAYERAARFSHDVDQWHLRLCAAAAAAWTGGLHQRAVALIGEIESRSAADHTRAQTLRIRAQIAASGESLSAAIGILEQAASAATEPDDTVWLLADALHQAFYLADSAATHRLGESVELAVTRSSSACVRAVALAATGMAKVLTGRDGIDDLRAAVPMLAEHADPVAFPEALPWLLTAPLFLRDAGSGAELRRIVDDVRSRMGVGLLPGVLFHVARDQATSAAWSRATANYEEGIRLARETGQQGELAMSLAGLAWLESRQGRAEGCREHAAESVLLSTERGIRMSAAWCLFAVGDLELACGDALAAAAAFQDLCSKLDEWGIADPDLRPGAELVDALLRLGRVEQAAAEATRFAAAAHAKGRPWSAARAYRALGLIAGDDEIDVPFLAALEAHQETRDLFESARSLLAYGARLRRAGRRVDARVQLRLALAAFDELGADRWGRVAATELEATGERVVRRAASGTESLTAQEMQVSLLLAEGRTTRETAAALFLSPKTVEYHLRKVYTKLGIRSRGELARLLDAQG